VREICTLGAMRRGLETLGLIGSAACTSVGMAMIAEAALSVSPFERSRWRLRRTRHPYGFSYGFSIATIWRETSCTLSLRGFTALVGALITPIVYQSRDMGQAFAVMHRT